MIVRAASNRLDSRTRAGFTLLEVLVVVAILVILATVATFSVVSYLRGAREDQATLQAQNIQKAAMSYYAKAGIWPQSLEILAVRDPSNGVGPFLEGGASSITDPWGQPYQFNVIQDESGNERFVVFTTSPDGKQIQWPRQ
jgi:general secretion pathway protein G